MPYARPTLTQLFAQALQDIQNSGVPGIDAMLTKSVLRALAWAEVGLAQEHYGYQDYIGQQAVPFTADGEFLEGWAALKDVFRKPATAAGLVATFTGSPGVDLPSGSAMSTVNGLAFASTADATIPAGGSVVVPVTASALGSGYNLAIGTTISLSTPITGINASGIVSNTTVVAADIETDDDLRTRMLEQYANPPQGGSQSDYVEWAEAVPGVDRAWCSPSGYGAGTVVVYVMLDASEAAFAGFPQGTNGVAAAETRDVAATGDQLVVANALYPLRAATALVYVFAPLPFPINFAIADVLPATTTIAAGIQQALADLFLRIGTPLGSTLYPSDWTAAISSVAGLEHFAVTSPIAPVAVPAGYLPTVGTVSPTP